MIDNNITFANIRTLSSLIKNRELSPVELIDGFIEKIEELNPILSAFITVTYDLARQAAKKAEKDIMNGDYRGMLHGLPIALKDNIFTNGILTIRNV